jgi:pimeloyl-ACP methyl ester carboxylesterase
MTSIFERKTLAASAIAAAMATATLSPAHAAEPSGTVVLVHGAFGDGSSWAKVTPQLQARNLEVIAVQLPLTSLADDVAATRRAIARAAGPVTLVGHSWGGTVITEAGVSDKVKALVYLAAFAHEPNTNVHDIADAYPAPGLKHVVADPNGFVRLSPKGISEFFAPRASDAEKATLTATQAPIRGASFSDKVQNAAWKTKPSWFVLAEQDQMIMPALQTVMAERIKAKTVRLASDHAAALTHPGEVAAAIIEAASTK